jgi:LCP family protein required for cell wall assembly
MSSPSTGRARPPASTSAGPADDDLDAPRVAGRASVGAGAGTGGLYGRPARGGRAPVGSPGGPGGGGPGGPGQGPGDPDGPSGPPRRRIRPRWGRIALVVGVVLALVAGGIALGGYLFVKHIDAKFQHIDAFSTIPGQRPAKTNDGSQNILLLGSDSRDAAATADLSGWRTDTIMLMHVTADHKHAYVISIPRDSWLHVPQSMSQPNHGNTNAKINAAFSWGGVPLTVETVEQFTNVYIDHVVLINFGGFEEVTNALGGVDMYVDKTITSIHKPHRVFTKGRHHFNGAQALDYVRQREQFGNGDLTRVKHQQEFLKAIMDKATSTGTLTSIGKLNSFLGALSKAVLVDKGFDVGSMAWQLHSLRSSDMTFLTSPTSGFATEVDGESAVVVDKAKAATLYTAVRNDTVGAWIKGNKTS